MISSCLVVNHCDLESGKCARAIWPLHMHLRIILSQNVVTKIEYTVTHQTIGAWIAFATNILSKIAFCPLTPPAMQEQAPVLRPNPISTQWSTIYAIYWGKSWRVQQALNCNRQQIRCRDGWERCNCFLWLGFLHTKPLMATSWARSRMRHWWLSEDAIKSLNNFMKCCRYRCGYIIVHLRLNNNRDLHVQHSVLLISLMEVAGCTSQSRLRQFNQCHLLLPKSLHATVYCFGSCVHHPAGFVIFTKVTQLSIFSIIIHDFPIVVIIGTCKMAQTIFNVV